MDSVLRLIGRERSLFEDELVQWNERLGDLVAGGRFLVIGGAGSIGQAVVREIFRRKPKVLHVVDISENNLVEVVRDIRSTEGYIEGDFRTFAIDAGSVEFRALMKQSGGYDYVLNLWPLSMSAAEGPLYPDAHGGGERAQYRGHAEGCGALRGEKVLLRIDRQGDQSGEHDGHLEANHGALPAQRQSAGAGLDRAFCQCGLLRRQSAAWLHRSAGKEPALSAPRDVKRFFITQEESGVLCLMSCLLGENRDIFFRVWTPPKTC